LADLPLHETVDCFALLIERNRKAIGDRPYYICKFADSKTSFGAPLFADHPLFTPCEHQWKVGECYKLRTQLIETEKYGKQLLSQQVRVANEDDKADGFDPLDLLEQSRFDSNALFDELRGIAESGIEDVPLRTLILDLLDTNREQLVLVRGSENKYHVFAGGWVEHSLSVTVTCRQLGEKYRAHYPELKPPLNLDLLTAASILHDIGRVAEFGGPLQTEPTKPGRLLGHIVLARDMVHEAARDIPDLDAELLLLLDHVIMSHLTLPEWGSPRLPWIPEVLILHHACDLDAKLQMYVHNLTTDQSPGPFTDKDPALGRQLLKGRRI